MLLWILAGVVSFLGIASLIIVVKFKRFSIWEGITSAVAGIGVLGLVVVAVFQVRAILPSQAKQARLNIRDTLISLDRTYENLKNPPSDIKYEEYNRRINDFNSRVKELVNDCTTNKGLRENIWTNTLIFDVYDDVTINKDENSEVIGVTYVETKGVTKNTYKIQYFVKGTSK